MNGPPIDVKRRLRRLLSEGRRRRRRDVERAIVETLHQLGRACTAGELSQSGRRMGGIRSSERDEALERLVEAGQVVAGEQVRLWWGAARCYRISSLPTSAGRVP
jgi:hypothetical protein